jgi:1,4-dihydroxy-2-naphthoyl-CoA synthase
MRENTVFELAMLVRTMAKGVVPSMISIKDMSIGYGHVMSIMADTKVSKASLD